MECRVREGKWERGKGPGVVGDSSVKIPFLTPPHKSLGVWEDVAQASKVIWDLKSIIYPRRPQRLKGLGG